LFSLGECAKKEHYKKSQSKSSQEFLTQPNSTKIDLLVGITDVINCAKFGDDRSKIEYYKVTEGRILPCSIGMTGRLFS